MTLVLRLLNQRLGAIAPELESQTRQLSLPALKALAEDLLDFESENDLANW